MLLQGFCISIRPDDVEGLIQFYTQWYWITEKQLLLGNRPPAADGRKLHH